METRARYAIIGAFVLACIFAGFGFIYWLQNSGSLGRTVYRVEFDQPIAGLTPGASVLFNGLRVGVVLDLKLDPVNPKRVNVSIAVDPSTPIRADTTVDISFQGLTGAPAIALKGGCRERAAPDAAKRAATFAHCCARRGSEFDRIGAKHAAPDRHNLG